MKSGKLSKLRFTAIFATALFFCFMQQLYSKTENPLSANEKQELLNMLEKDPNDFVTICNLCAMCTITGEYTEAMNYSDRLLEMTTMDSVSYTRFTALAYAGQAYLASDKYDRSIGLLTKALDLWNCNRNDSSFWYGKDMTPVSILYNSMAVYCISYDLDYEKATEYFIEGLEFARDNNMSTDYSIISYNLIMTYFIRKDAAGLKYAKEIYENGVKSGNERLVYMGAYESAMMYYLQKDYANAEKYIRTALKSPVTVDSVWVNTIYALILNETGKTTLAENYFKKAIKSIGKESSTTASYVCLSYGKFLSGQKRDREAIDIFHRGLAIADTKMNKVFIYQLYEALSDAYSQLGENRKALLYYRKYHQLSDSVFNIKKEKTIHELTIKYNTAVHEAEIQEKNMLIMRKNHMLAFALIITIVIIAISAIILILYRNKNYMYTKIVRQYQEALRREKTLEEAISSAIKTPQQENREDNGEPLDREKSMLIINRLEELMEKEKAYKDNTLSRDKLAEMIGTNRTYLSKVINDRYGKSVNRYINTYRINKAMELLSIPDSNMPMKAVEYESGFNSSSNFFKLFKDEVGMTPTNFRKKVLELSKKQHTY